ncbi:MAG: shikimate dehydrogenase [Desulfarculaceae bacterium]|nr:shikimate dehydrogenase [Desulfarculaceae bacterium]
MKSINSQTDLYCIFGSPVGHSKSPAIHNMLFAEYGINAAYLAFEPENMKSGIAAVRSFGIKGVSVTIPFKEEVIQYLDETDDEALRIGAVNTVVYRSGILKGYNTDCFGAVAPLRDFGIEGKRIGIIGAGGAARAAGFGMIRESGKVTVINRSVEKGEKLATALSCPFLKLEEIGSRKFDILINTTPSGMFPDTEESPVPDHVLKPGMVVMDMVYNPVETLLLRQAGQRGCHAISGIEMFICQGAKQFELWTGISPSIDKLRQVMTEETV